MPRIRLESPKITRKLTTECFANRVQSRYQACVNEAFARLKNRSVARACWNPNITVRKA